MKIDAASNLARLRWVNAYSEDEARDAHGRWTKGGPSYDKQEEDPYAQRRREETAKAVALMSKWFPEMAKADQKFMDNGWTRPFANMYNYGKTAETREGSTTYRKDGVPGRVEMDSKTNWTYIVPPDRAGRRAYDKMADQGTAKDLDFFLGKHKGDDPRDIAKNLQLDFANKASIPDKFADRAAKDMQYVAQFKDVMNMLSYHKPDDIAYIGTTKGGGKDSGLLAYYNGRGAGGRFGDTKKMIRIKASDSLEFQGKWASATMDKPEQDNPFQRMAGYRTTGIHNVGGDLPDQAARNGTTLLHEIGHHVQTALVMNQWNYQDHEDMNTLYQKNLAAWNNAKSTNPSISLYAKTNEKEYFAENFAAYHIYPDRLKEVDPQGYEVQKEVSDRWGKARG